MNYIYLIINKEITVISLNNADFFSYTSDLSFLK